MARPIRNTPILMGEDAVRFIERASQIPCDDRRLAERARIEESVRRLQKMIAAL